MPPNNNNKSTTTLNVPTLDVPTAGPSSDRGPLTPRTVEKLFKRISMLTRKLENSTADPFDVKDPTWTLKRTVEAAVQKSKRDGMGAISPYVCLAWKDLFLYGNQVENSTQKNVTSLFTFPITLLQRLGSMPREKTILNGIDGILHPGEMLLVLGTPGSGVSSLLKVLAGKVEEYRACIGSITYSGIPAQIMRERFASMLGFSGAEDYHFPYLTVGQTLEFAASLKAPHQRFDGMTREKFIELTRDVLLATFGLQHTINTRVGNDFVRGVSGGERRRVSVAEMVCSLPICEANSRINIHSASIKSMCYMLG